MMTRRILIVALRVATPALLILIAVTREEGVSVRMWLTGASVWIAGVLVWDLLAVAAPEPAELRVAWRRSHRSSAYRGPVLAGLRSDVLVLRDALRDPRVHASRLRPHLAWVAEHFVPLRHGFDPERDSQRMKQLLGEVGWLLDPEETERTPTATEIDRFLTIVLADDRKGVS